MVKINKKFNALITTAIFTFSTILFNIPVGNIITTKPVVHAATITNTISISAIEDTYTNKTNVDGNGSAPGFPHDGSNNNHVGITSNEYERSAVKFDLSAVPTGATITNALFQFNVTSSSGGPIPLNILYSGDDNWSETGKTVPYEIKQSSLNLNGSYVRNFPITDVGVNSVDLTGLFSGRFTSGERLFTVLMAGADDGVDPFFGGGLIVDNSDFSYASHSSMLTVTYTQPMLSNDNTLSGLSLSCGSLTPGFAPGTTDYAIFVPNSTLSTVVVPTANTSSESIKVKGSTVSSGSPSQIISLNEGNNIITISVTAEDGSIKNYTVTVMRQAAAQPEGVRTAMDGQNNVIFQAMALSGSIDTNFSGDKNVTISGLNQAPDRTYGTFNGQNLTVNNQTVSVHFTNGVAVVPLALNRAGNQIVNFSVDGVVNPITDVYVQTSPGPTQSMYLYRDIYAPMINGQGFQGASVIQLRDSHGNIATNDNTTQVTVSKKDLGQWTLAGTTTVTAVNGIATFGDLTPVYTTEVSNAQVAFNSNGLSEVLGGLVTLPGISAASVFVAADGENSIRIEAQDASGNVDTTFNGTKNVMISGVSRALDGSLGTFNGQNLIANGQIMPLNFVNGVAHASLTLNRAGIQEISFNVSGVTNSMSNRLTLRVSSGAATSMRIYNDLLGPTVNGGNFAGQPVIQLMDIHGNVADTDNTTQVTATKKDLGAWTLTGITTATASNGVIAFSNLGAQSNQAVLNAQLEFDALGLGPIASGVFSIPLPVASQDSTLRGLQVSSGVLSPGFSSTISTYNMLVGNMASSININPTTNDSHATVKVNGTVVTSGTASNAVQLNVGNNVITVLVTAQDGSTKTYTVNVTRLPYTAPVVIPPVLQAPKPQIVGATSNGNGTTTNFMPDKKMQVAFDTEIDPTSLTSDSVYVLDATGNKVNATLQYNSETKKLTITPTGYYESGESYTVHVTDKVLSTDGTAVNDELTYNFDVKVPLKENSKLKEYTDVSTNKQWTITLNKSIDVSKLDSSNVKIYDENCNEINAQLSTEDGKKITVNTGSYEKGKTYYLVVDKLVSEDGKTLKSAQWIKFTT